MTDIDRQHDIDLHAANEHLVVGVPLIGLVSGEWCRRYQRLANASGVPVQVQADHHRAWIVVRVPASGNHRDVTATMEAAHALIGDTDAAEQAATPTSAEVSVREWWAQRRMSGPSKPTSKFGTARTGLGAERRWPLLVALALAIALPLLLPSRFSLGPSWLVPLILAVLVTSVAAAERVAGDRRLPVVRVLSLALVAVLVAEAAGVTARLIADLLEGGPETSNATDLISIGFGVWVYTILAFAFLYWVVDGGGPDSRQWAPSEYPQLAFPEQLNPVVAPPGWHPQFFDYLYLGFTNATAFSPTDVMPLSRWAKAIMTTQAAASLAILGLVIARAVNILQ